MFGLAGRSDTPIHLVGGVTLKANPQRSPFKVVRRQSRMGVDTCNRIHLGILANKPKGHEGGRSISLRGTDFFNTEVAPTSLPRRIGGDLAAPSSKRSPGTDSMYELRLHL